MSPRAEYRERPLHIALYTSFIFLLTFTTLVFGIRYGQSTSCTAPPASVQECPRTAVSPMWDVHHVPNPPPAYTPKVFKPISDLKSFTSRELAINDKSWDKLLKGDFIHVEKSNGEIINYGVSMSHQMHCLNMIRQMLLGQSMSQAHEVEDWSEDAMHWLHCLDYLAQVSCCDPRILASSNSIFREFFVPLMIPWRNRRLPRILKEELLAGLMA